VVDDVKTNYTVEKSSSGTLNFERNIVKEIFSKFVQTLPELLPLLCGKER
jgi:hypothetical protein